MDSGKTRRAHTSYKGPVPRKKREVAALGRNNFDTLDVSQRIGALGAGRSRERRGSLIQKPVRHAAQETWTELRDPVDMFVPRAKRTALRTRPRDVLRDPFLRELLHSDDGFAPLNRSKLQVSVNTPKELSVAEVLFSLANMRSDRANGSAPAEDDSTDNSLPVRPKGRTSTKAIRQTRRREARNPQPRYVSGSDLTDSEQELWKEPVAVDSKPAPVKTRTRASRTSNRPRRSCVAKDNNNSTTARVAPDVFGDVAIPRAKRSKTTVRKAIPEGSVWSGSSGHGEAKLDSRRSNNNYAEEGKSLIEEYTPTIEDYMRGLLGHVVPPSDHKEDVGAKLTRGGTSGGDDKEREGPVPASLKRSFRRNSAHSYIARFIRWHKQNSKDVDWEDGSRGTAISPPPSKSTKSGSGEPRTIAEIAMDMAREAAACSASNPNQHKQSLPVAWPTYLPSTPSETATPSSNGKANAGMNGSLIPPSQYSGVLSGPIPSYMQMSYLSGSNGGGGSNGRGGGNVPFSPFAPFPPPLGAMQIQGNRGLTAAGGGDVKSPSGGGIVGMMSSQYVPDGYRQ
ncbi:hypothetical protein BSKO_11839 [Bryopsis sp. KO-2023]|nr:hypothetical protein BSKO_11839 [Bryopsis sp. KO-2023]